MATHESVLWMSVLGSLLLLGGCPREAPIVGSEDAQPSQDIDVDDGTVQLAQAISDRDLDGFAHAIDPAPDDAAVPAPLGSPEAILAHPLVIAALAEAEARGIEFTIDTALDPTFDIAGSYSWDWRGSEFLASDDRSYEGAEVAAGTQRLQRVTPGLYRSTHGTNAEEDHQLSGASTVYVRGSASHYTAYGVNRALCDYAHPAYAAALTIGSVDSATGDLIDSITLVVNVYADGYPHCGKVGSQVPGAWYVYAIPRTTRER